MEEGNNPGYSLTGTEDDNLTSKLGLGHTPILEIFYWGEIRRMKLST